MKIAIVTPVLGRAGGMGRVVEEHAQWLAARGHEVTVFVSLLKSKNWESGKLGNCKIVTVKPRLRYGHGAWVPSLTRALAEFPLVHLHYPFLGGTGAVLKWRRLTKTGRLIVTYHMDLVGRGVFRPIFRAYQKLTLPKLVRAADRILVSSLDYGQNGDLAPLLPRLGGRLVEIPFGVDTERFAPREPDAALRDSLKISPDEAVILFVGGLDRAHYFKGVPVLLRAVAALRREAARVRLLIVGSGGLLKTYQELARRLKIADAVTFAPSVPPEELARYYSLADVLVLPSLDRSEAFGLVLLEAQASGVPVIISDLPGVRTALEDQKTGFVFTRGDVEMLWKAIAWMLTHPEEHALMRRAARTRVEEKYQWKPIIDRLEGIYRELSSPT